MQARRWGPPHVHSQSYAQRKAGRRASQCTHTEAARCTAWTIRLSGVGKLLELVSHSHADEAAHKPKLPPMQLVLCCFAVPSHLKFCGSRAGLSFSAGAHVHGGSGACSLSCTQPQALGTHAAFTAHQSGVLNGAGWAR